MLFGNQRNKLNHCLVCAKIDLRVAELVRFESRLTTKGRKPSTIPRSVPVLRTIGTRYFRLKCQQRSKPMFLVV